MQLLFVILYFIYKTHLRNSVDKHFCLKVLRSGHVETQRWIYYLCTALVVYTLKPYTYNTQSRYTHTIFSHAIHIQYSVTLYICNIQRTLRNTNTLQHSVSHYKYTQSGVSDIKLNCLLLKKRQHCNFCNSYACIN